MEDTNDPNYSLRYRDDPEVEGFHDDAGDDAAFEGDIYSNSPGDAISGNKHGRGVRPRRSIGTMLLIAGILFLGVGGFVALRGRNSSSSGSDSDSDQLSKKTNNDDQRPLDLTSSPVFAPTPRPTPAPSTKPLTAGPSEPKEDVTVEPTAAPSHFPTELVVEDTMPPTAVPTPVPTVQPTAVPTVAPTTESDGLMSLLTARLGTDAFLDSESVASRAFNWLLSNDDIASYDDKRRLQRFAAASIFYSTTSSDSMWNTSDKWMSQASECEWYGITCDSKHNIEMIDLADNGLKGTVPYEIKLISKQLLVLKLGQNELTNEEPEDLAWIAELTNLRGLTIQENDFKADGVPTQIKGLVNLQVLDLSKNHFHGTLHTSPFKSLRKLKYLSLSGNRFDSHLPRTIAKLPLLEALYIQDVHLKGDFEFLGLFKKALEVWMDDNPKMEGSIPTTIGDVETLESLSISNCNVTGIIPSEIGQLKSLKQVWLTDNSIVGKVPTQIGELTDLYILQLESNAMTGSMPTEVCNIWNETVADSLNFQDITPAGHLLALSSDCDDNDDFECSCCSCCKDCPTVGIDL